MTEAQLEKLATDGSIPLRGVVHWRAPPPEEVSPHPRPDVADRLAIVRLDNSPSLGGSE